jgi:DNA-binding LacI/PurR family transcriptional regulator
VGQFLQELGHKRVAFVSRFHRDLWSQQRYAGLSQGLSGASDCIKLLEIPTTDSALLPNAPAILQSIEKIAGINNCFPLRASVVATQEYTEIVPRLQGLGVLRSQYDMIWNHFKDLFSDTSITAVVGSQDYTAILAHEYLRQVRIAVPEKISIIGFDNHEMAIEDDLTSYHFLFSNIAADVLAYIINPTAPAFAGQRAIECSGTVIQRSTTGPARKR